MRCSIWHAGVVAGSCELRRCPTLSHDYTSWETPSAGGGRGGWARGARRSRRNAPMAPQNAASGAPLARPTAPAGHRQSDHARKRRPGRRHGAKVPRASNHAAKCPKRRQVIVDRHRRRTLRGNTCEKNNRSIAPGQVTRPRKTQELLWEPPSCTDSSAPVARALAANLRRNAHLLHLPSLQGADRSRAHAERRAESSSRSRRPRAARRPPIACDPPAGRSRRRSSMKRRMNPPSSGAIPDCVCPSNAMVDVGQPRPHVMAPFKQCRLWEVAALARGARLRLPLQPGDFPDPSPLFADMLRAESTKIKETMTPRNSTRRGCCTSGRPRSCWRRQWAQIWNRGAIRKLPCVAAGTRGTRRKALGTSPRCVYPGPSAVSPPTDLSALLLRSCAPQAEAIRGEH